MMSAFLISHGSDAGCDGPPEEGVGDGRGVISAFLISHGSDAGRNGPPEGGVGEEGAGGWGGVISAIVYSVSKL